MQGARPGRGQGLRDPMSPRLLMIAALIMLALNVAGFLFVWLR